MVHLGQKNPTMLTEKWTGLMADLTVLSSLLQSNTGDIQISVIEGFQRAVTGAFQTIEFQDDFLISAIEDLQVSVTRHLALKELNCSTKKDTMCTLTMTGVCVPREGLEGHNTQQELQTPLIMI